MGSDFRENAHAQVLNHILLSVQAAVCAFLLLLVAAPLATLSAPRGGLVSFLRFSRRPRVLCTLRHAEYFEGNWCALLLHILLLLVVKKRELTFL